jgi:DNA-binding response OmpR family regulator
VKPVKSLETRNTDKEQDNGRAAASLGDARDGEVPDTRRTALAVASDVPQLAMTAQALRSLDYAVIAVSTFDEARKHLLTIPELTLLVADIRLGQFNGLHLAFRARAHYPDVRLVITDHAFDSTLEAETRRLGGAYVPRPFTAESLAAVIAQREERPATQQGGTRRWPRTPVDGVVAAVGPRSARLFDVSYGGLCLEFSPGEFDAALPSELDIELRDLGLSLRMHPVWVRTTSSSPAWLCGGELIAADSPAMVQWREFVDSRRPS